MSTDNVYANFESLERGLFLFNHNIEGCGTTLAVEIVNFTDLYTGSIYSEPLTGSEECPEHCLYKDDLDMCSAKCECSYIREIIQILKNRKNTKQHNL